LFQIYYTAKIEAVSKACYGGLDPPSP